MEYSNLTEKIWMHKITLTATQVGIILQRARASQVATGAKKPSFFKVFRFLGFKGFLRFNIRKPDKNYDPELHEEYLIHDTPFPPPRHL